MQLISPYRDESCAERCYKQLLPPAAPGPRVPPAWLLEPSLLCPFRANGCGHCFPVCRHRTPMGMATQTTTGIVLPSAGLLEDLSIDQPVQLDLGKWIPHTHPVWAGTDSHPPATSPRHTGYVWPLVPLQTLALSPLLASHQCPSSWPLLLAVPPPPRCVESETAQRNS